VDLEAHLHRNGTRIVKVFLICRRRNKRKRFIERIDEPEKNGIQPRGHSRKEILEGLYAGL